MDFGLEAAAAERAGMIFRPGKNSALAPMRCGLEPLVPEISAKVNGCFSAKAATSCS
jgi:hypothetical protein